MDFIGKVVVITGASAGIGAAIAVKFAEQKARIVLIARNKERLQAVAKICQEYGAETMTIIADVSKDNELKEAVIEIMANFKEIDVLVNNAGFIAIAAVDDPNAMDVYDRIMNTNLRSVVYLTNIAAPYLIKNKGNIINISSIAAIDPISPKHFSYCTSKAGMDHFTRCAAVDLGVKGVRVNTVNPGPVRTSIIAGFDIRESDQEDFWNGWKNHTLLGRVSYPEEIGDLVLFLASPKAKAITGSSFTTDNGVLLKRDIQLE